MNHLNFQDPQSVRQFLFQQRQELETRLDGMRRSLATPLDQDLDDQAFELEDNEVTMAVSRELEQELTAVGRALHRLDLGRFGICEDCGNDITSARLQANPLTPYCLDCASRH